MNKSDSERFAGYLEGFGLKSVNERKKADIVVINTCGVRQSAEDRIYGLAPRIKKDNKRIKLIITGCLTMREDVRSRLKDCVDIWLPINELPKLGKLLKQVNKKTYHNYLDIWPKHESKISAFVPIGNGCNNFCAYCVVPYARGREVYRPADDIINEVKTLVGNGYKEIVLIAQNVNSYRCNKLTFPELLDKVNSIEENFWIRFATSHPKDMSDKLINTIAKCEKVTEHIHLPAQAGDNKILKAMNRKYTRKHYIDLINKIRNIIPNAAITTDIIVGFPGETKKEFNNTAKLFKEAGFDMAYIAQYSPRYGTAAYDLVDNVEKDEKRRREDELMELLRKTALKNNKEYLGKVVEILVNEKNKKNEWLGYTRTGKNVKIINTGKEDFKGEFVKVKIIRAKDFGMEGEIVNEKKKAIVVVGPTASGKTKYAVELARKFNGEIISADSRQVYIGMDIGAGKDFKEYEINEKGKKIKIPYHLIDVAEPKDQFDLAQWKKAAEIALQDIFSRGKVPIIVGGTGLYAQALVDGYALTSTTANDALRRKLEKKSKEDLFSELKKINKSFAEKLNNSEKNNKRRLIRYIEILKDGQKGKINKEKRKGIEFEIIGLNYPREELKKRIYKRLIDRLEKEGMIDEVKRLHEEGLAWERLEKFGLEYKFISLYLQDKMDHEDMVQKLFVASCQYAKRQMTWLKRWEKQGTKINWIKKEEAGC